MEIRRPLAAVLTALALFGGGATLTGCGNWGPTTPNEGTTDDEGTADEGVNDRNRETERPGGNLPNNSDPEIEQELDDDTSDPD
jgi:hypothetical protein